MIGISTYSSSKNWPNQSSSLYRQVYHIVMDITLSCNLSHNLKGVLHPSTKISMFCLFSPSSRGKLILFMYGRDRCVWFKVKKHDIVSMDLRISHVERFKIFFPLFNLINHFKINGINSCFYYSWNHPFSVKKIHSVVKKLLYLIRPGNLKLAPLYNRRLKCPWNHPKYVFF